MYRCPTRECFRLKNVPINSWVNIRDIINRTNSTVTITTFSILETMNAGKDACKMNCIVRKRSSRDGLFSAGGTS